MPIYTNLLEVYFWLPAPAENISLLEMETDGSFTIVADLTNQQRLTLTTNQVQSMVAGSFYLEVDLEDGSYLGQLEPEYAFANGPTVRMWFFGHRHGQLRGLVDATKATEDEPATKV